MLGETDAVIAGYLSETVQRERVRDAETQAARPDPAPVAAPEIVRSVQGRHRFGNGAAAIVGAELKGREDVVLRVTFSVLAKLANPIAGFLVRNAKGETIFGSNSVRENFPLPRMEPGDIHTVDFHWTMPRLSAGRYSVSVAVSEGTLGEFGVCDYGRCGGGRIHAAWLLFGSDSEKSVSRGAVSGGHTSGLGRVVRFEDRQTQASTAHVRRLCFGFGRLDLRSIFCIFCRSGGTGRFDPAFSGAEALRAVRRFRQLRRLERQGRTRVCCPLADAASVR
jgi:hypothetical protein